MVTVVCGVGEGKNHDAILPRLQKMERDGIVSQIIRQHDGGAFVVVLAERN